MNIWNHKRFSLSIIKSGKGEPFHLKPLAVPHLDSMSELRWMDDDTYISTNFFVPFIIQVFWFWWIVEIQIKKEKLSEMKMVKYEATHYAMLNEVLK